MLGTVVPKDEIRLRIAAAKALNPNVGTWDEAGQSHQDQHLHAEEHRRARPQGPRRRREYLHVIAEACGLPYAWFTVPDLGAAVRREDEDPSLVERVEALEHAVAALVRRDGAYASSGSARWR